MEVVHNKLVRDNIPNIIEGNNETAVIHILSETEYKSELFKKLSEECSEVISSKSSEELVEELADVLEVIKSIAELEGKSLDSVIEVADKKRLKRGGFAKRIYLEKTIK